MKDEIATDIVVIGSGGAGLRAAIAAREEGLATLLLSRCSTGLATATVISKGAFNASGFERSAEEHVQNTLEVGYFLNDTSLVNVLAREAPLRIEEVQKRGARFTRFSSGFQALREKPDTGREVVNVLLSWARGCGVTMVAWCTVGRLLHKDGRVTGCIAIGRDGRLLTINAKAVIACTGGASALYKFHDNPTANLGDGYALAFQTGAHLRDMEFIQFYPFISYQAHTPRMLIHPFLADRGLVLNDKNENLLEKYGLTELKPLAVKARDKLSRAMCQEYQLGNMVYLDLRMLSEGDWSHPSARDVREIFKRWLQTDKKPVCIAPVAHFTMGGIVIDDWARTSVEGLFAAGESACGLHGANRLGGNALSETVVFGYRAGVAAARYCRDQSDRSRSGAASVRFDPADYSKGKHLPRQVLDALRETLWNFCGPVRRKQGLLQALESIQKLKHEGVRCADASQLSLAVAVSNSMETAEMIGQAALDRRESIGAHYRED